jgi:hypothetical protein
MREREVVLVDRDARSRPRSSWTSARALAEGHALSTLSIWSYARDTVRFGGLPAALPAATALIALTGAFLAVGYAAALLAASADEATTRAVLLVFGSVALSQALSAIQSRRPARRLFIVSALRVSELPEGWGIAWIEAPSYDASETRRVLMDAGFPYVEVTYYRHADTATLGAYYRLQEPSVHAAILVADAIGSRPHKLRSATINPGSRA